MTASAMWPPSVWYDQIRPSRRIAAVRVFLASVRSAPEARFDRIRTTSHGRGVRGGRLPRAGRGIGRGVAWGWSVSALQNPARRARPRRGGPDDIVRAAGFGLDRSPLTTRGKTASDSQSASWGAPGAATVEMVRESVGRPGFRDQTSHPLFVRSLALRRASMAINRPRSPARRSIVEVSLLPASVGGGQLHAAVVGFEFAVGSVAAAAAP